ncbi:hypothetical protein EVAR_21799_1 [Eumeta japonica]|uniref:Uncharacterized protein n=1 Tax=Eumeta variegata TaxID=151549 RepID=A0A4C1YL21_EUMVA|nr:hypothetical protein EVAR_21799_1 [Eumeta japonica]
MGPPSPPGRLSLPEYLSPVERAPICFIMHPSPFRIVRRPTEFYIYSNISNTSQGTFVTVNERVHQELQDILEQMLCRILQLPVDVLNLNVEEFPPRMTLARVA